MSYMHFNYLDLGSSYPLVETVLWKANSMFWSLLPSIARFRFRWRSLAPNVELMEHRA